jgi:hypothetical protein
VQLLASLRCNIPGGCTLHSLFKLAIDEESRRRFVSDIGPGSVHGECILRADLIMIAEVSMLTPWVVIRVAATLECIAGNQMGFGSRKRLCIGDLLQLPLVVANYGMPVAERLITRLPCWPLMRQLRLEEHVLCG